MTNKDKRVKPKLSSEHDLLRPSDVWSRERFIEKARFEGGVMPGADGERLVFDNCVFKDMSFANSRLERRGIRRCCISDMRFLECPNGKYHAAPM